MAAYGIPIAVTLIVWWVSTGAILYLDGLPRATFRRSFAIATAAGLLALWGLVATAEMTSVAGAYLAVLCALTVWGWNEMAFLLGFVTGSQREPALSQTGETARFIGATRAILHHELALAASLCSIAVLTWNGTNGFGLATFALLFAMRLSTKLNIFLGVPNTTAEFLPAHLAYLKRYFRQRSMNLLFPFSVTAATLLSAFLIHKVAFAADPHMATGYALLAALCVLGLIEHWFLVVPLPVAQLWSWGFRSHAAQKAVPVTSRNAAEAATPRAISPSSLVA